MKGRKRLVCVLIFIAILLMCFAFLRWRGLLLFWNEAEPKAYKVFGVDVSSYQGDVDWHSLAAQGVDFAFIKATEGSGHQDSYFAENWAEASVAGIPAGAYHFFSYDSSGQTQAENFIAAVPLTEGMLPPVVDIEFYGDYLAAPKAAESVQPELQIMLHILEAHYGCKPILYVTRESYRLYVEGRFEGYPLWHTLPIFAPFWRDWTFWQYSHHAQMEGYVGKEKYIDLNVFRGTKEELKALLLRK